MAFLFKFFKKPVVQSVTKMFRMDNYNPTSGAITILYGSKTGNASFIAHEMQKYLQQKGMEASCTDMASYKPQNLKKESVLLIVISTHGEGEPPQTVQNFFTECFSSDFAQLPNLSYAVCALGDSSYTRFCQAGRDIDNRLAGLGATRSLNRTDCDVEFRAAATQWIADVYKKIKDGDLKTHIAITEETTSSVDKNWLTTKVTARYPLYKTKSGKECWHITLETDHPEFTYEPGDCLGILPQNNALLVNQLIQTLGYAEGTTTETPHGAQTIANALTHQYEITTINLSILERYLALTHNPDLKRLLAEPSKRDEYIRCSDLLDLVTDYTSAIAPADFLSLLNPIYPRLYSLSSSQITAPKKADITVRSVKKDYRNRQRLGTCSVPLCDDFTEGEALKLFIKKNPNFRLPTNNKAPVIMIAAGTGIAPFRAFLHEREKTGATGNYWLFVGDRSLTDGFLYRNEMEQLQSTGILKRLNVAYSRESQTPAYIQQTLRDNGPEVAQWIDSGAYLYVCGLEKMASDVRETLVQILIETKKIPKKQASTMLHNLHADKRYCVDAY
jgi:sulfite reductase (NADPH) flavoprotein alpha-component